MMAEPVRPDPAETLAQRFHEAYERLAPEHGYETRKESAVPWEDVPAQNKALMIAVIRDLALDGLAAELAEHERERDAKLDPYVMELSASAGREAKRRVHAEADLEAAREALRHLSVILTNGITDDETKLRVARESVQALRDKIAAGSVAPPDGDAAVSPAASDAHGTMMERLDDDLDAPKQTSGEGHEVHPPDSRAESQVELNGPGGSPPPHPERDIEKLRRVIGPLGHHANNCNLIFDRECGICTCGFEDREEALATLYRLEQSAQELQVIARVAHDVIVRLSAEIQKEFLEGIARGVAALPDETRRKG